MLTADLHIHTTASDGRLSPTDIVKEAIRAKLSYIAITDHDTVDGLLQLNEMTQSIPDSLKIIPGIELSTDLPENEVHILGYHIDIHHPELRNQLNILINHRHERAKQMIDKLNQLGYSITYERVVELAVYATAIGRPHVAKALVEKKFFSTISDVFTTLLSKDGPAYVPHYKLTPKQVIDLIKKAGGVPVLAHPGLVGSDDIVLDVIHSGICGLEVYHPTHDERQIQKYHEMAKQYHLKITGGSDFHAIPARFPKQLGIFTVPADLACELQKPSTHECS
ncbi:PHP domain-containing protein [Pelosinus sp. sgz500959]|uniref:PHP domain-containing protein n=1 Tax=Pelosinus sp. sgz500959 TaxID=3242472 RepID=UPI00366E610E